MDRNNSLLTLDDSLNLEGKDVRSYFKEYVNPGLAQLFSLLNFDRKYVRAEGMEVWDDKGEKYIDFLGGYGSLNLGHNPEEILAAVERASKLPNYLQASINSLASCLAYNLSVITPGDLKMSFFCNSGAEAVEGALKLARAASGRSKIIYCEGAFHGKTYGALSVTGREKYQKPFGPLLPECYSIPYGDADFLEKMLRKKDVAAFIVEPIQGEGGVMVPPPGYLKEIRQLCDKYETLLIMDEIQTGLGRTGKMFACEWEGVEPDIMCIAKSLGGGVMPLGAYIATEECWKKAYGSTDASILHTSTFGGNSLASAAGIEAINQIVAKNLPDKAKEKGEYLKKGLVKLKDTHGFIDEVRGKGLMIGIHFNENTGMFGKLTRGYTDKLSREYLGAMVAGELINNYNIITAYTLNNPNVIRFSPPLIVESEHLTEMLNALEGVLEGNNSFFKMALTSSKTVLKSIFKK